MKKPTIRKEASLELHYRAVEAMFNVIENSPAGSYPFVNCLTCSHFDNAEDADMCKLYNMKPPARVVVYGCPSYEDGCDIPF